MRRISTSSRYVIDKIGIDPLSLRKFGGGGVLIRKNRKIEVF